jgi:uncharacterized protein (DUF1501 family)
MPTLNRRRFLQATALAGTSAWLFGPRLRASGAAAGPLLISVEARAAWDTTLTVDPTAHPNFSLYGEGQIREVGGLRVGPFDVSQPGWDVRHFSAGGPSGTVEFFSTYGSLLRVVNGVDHRTVSHDIGPRNAFSGSLRTGFPTIGALAAAAQGPNRPMAFISTGGFDDTQGIVTLTRAGRPNVIRELARPNSTNGTAANANNTNLFLPPDVEALVKQQQTARDLRRRSRLLAQNAVPRTQKTHQALMDARATEGDFFAFADTLDTVGATNDPNGLVASAGLVLAAMRANPSACAAAHLTFGSFDTHSDHDDPIAGHRPQMLGLLEGLAFLI